MDGVAGQKEWQERWTLWVQVNAVGMETEVRGSFVVEHIREDSLKVQVISFVRYS